MRAARLECCVARDMLVPPWFDPSTLRLGRPEVVGARSEAELVPGDDSHPTQVGDAPRSRNVESCGPGARRTRQGDSAEVVHQATVAASSVSFALAAAKRSRTCRSQAMSSPSRVTFPPTGA